VQHVRAAKPRERRGIERVTVHHIKGARRQPIRDRGERGVLRGVAVLPPERGRRIGVDPEVDDDSAGDKGAARSEQRHLVAACGQAAREVGDDRLRAADLRRALVDRRDERRDESDAHP